jgi:hypothetical protein
VAQGANSSRIADAAVARWRRIDAALSPIVGQRGVAALYQRSLHLTRAAHPCLAGVQEGERGALTFAGLHTALSQQTNAGAAAAHDALVQTFYELLANLIGASLTERLLTSTEDESSGGAAAQENMP